MLHWLRSAFWALLRLLLSLRYRVRVQGRKQLRGLKGPVIVFPNHPAYIDPAIVISALWPEVRLRPVLYEGLFLKPGYFRTPLAYPLIRLLDALLIPDLTQPSARARARAEQAVASVIDGLGHGENFILWPAGHVERDGVERLRAARALTDILRAAPDANVILVRTTGLWGSMFSYAQTAQRPPLRGRLRAAIGYLLASLLLFMPRRRVDITVEILDRSKLPSLQRDQVNRWFESWYNTGGLAEPVYVPYHAVFGRRSYEFPRAPETAALDVSKVTAETKAEVAHILEQRLGWPLAEAEQTSETTLDQLGLDSLARMEITLAVEQRFGFSGAQGPNTLGELWLLAQGLAEEAPLQPAPPEWSRSPASDAPPEIRGDTLLEAFVNQALAHPHDIAVADDLAGMLTYRRLLVGVLTLARRFAELPGQRVGLLLPASAACDMALLALHQGGKVPVLLNWTTGPSNLAHAARSMGLSHVVTSEGFLDRTGVQVEGVEYVYLEDLRQGISRGEQLRTLLGVWLRPGRVRRRLPKSAPDDPAVILFTSGSEKAPKAVPLTQRNLLSNQRAALGILNLTRQDCVLGFLPAFHSFGLTLTGLLPLLAGLRVVRHPDPTAAATLARKIGAYRPTLLAGTPTFVSAILGRARPEQLASLRLVFVGAEKCPPALREHCARLVPGAQLLEGYGITECGPAVALNRPQANRPGTVGQPVPGVEVCVVDPETEERLPPSQVGELWVSGPSVFSGYLAYEGDSPFRQRQGRQWYVTGDLAEVDTGGFIRLCGRKKRFLKAAGEMISLPALEEPFSRRYPPTEKGPRAAVEGVESEGGRRIVLFCTEPISLREANAVLHEEGFRGVMRLDEVRRLPAIPVLGTGKTDYRTLRTRISADAPAAELASR
jgi:long-chain-fatty-acid--[acyl-carrier-protein] ligase